MSARVVTLRAALAAVAGAGAAVAIAACGVQTKDSGNPTVPQGTNLTQTTTNGGTGGTGTTATRTVKALPPAPAGVVRVDGLPGRSGISADAATSFSENSTARVALIRATEGQSFRDLCAGRIDVIETGRLPTAAESSACRARGVDISEPLQVGADAIVLATKNESDVGGDCITYNQARDIYRAGSPYTNWSQLGFDNLRLRTAGREDTSPNFDFFGQIVLGLNAPTLADVRDDYVAHGTDKAEREDVTNDTRLRQAVVRARAYYARLRTRNKSARKRFVDARVAVAKRRFLKIIAAENRARAAKKYVLRPSDKARIARENLQRIIAYQNQARFNAIRTFDRRLLVNARAYYRRIATAADAPGVLAPFRFSYYELFEDVLRPLEIDYGVPTTASGQPVTADMLPLTPAVRAALVRVRTAPRQTFAPDGTVTTQTTPTGTATTTTPGNTVTVVAGDTATPANLAAAGTLPKKTKDGEVIYPGPNCVFPSQVTITTGAYPLTRRIFLFSYRQALRRTEVRNFVLSVLNNARAIATSNRLVPITDAQQADELAIVNNGGKTPAAPARTTTTARPTVTTRTVTTPSGTTTVQTVTTPARTTRTTATTTTATTAVPAQTSSGIPGVSSRGAIQPAP